ncbi:MAG: L-aspartate oxidase [Candidatus Marinimicrobia bacterium]|nr:L-aspartate oxidase [Candidatus Neomarinimicrobiota bacterium]
MKTDVLIIGCGLAGAISAIIAAENGKNVTIITKTKSLLSGNTPYAQGGIIFKGHDDTPDSLKSDILSAGDGICCENAIKELILKGPKYIQEWLINKFNIPFDLNGTEFHFTSEAAHSDARIIHVKDQTGKGIQQKILEEVETNSKIKVLVEHFAVDLLTLSHHSKNPKDIYKKPACFGAIVLDINSNEVFPIVSQNTILATGGLGQIYLHTSNPEEAKGDGIAMAWRAGARCFNMEYIQFHPTTLFHDSGRFLISEALRGEGAILIDVEGNEFMDKFHELGPLAPRDIVSRGIHQTMLETGHPCVYLDISFKSERKIKNRFPAIYSKCLEVGIDITKEPIPVVPSAHYSCGGIGVNLKGRTSLRRLYAVGEVSCTGVHGANRLASASLLECLVWGINAGIDVSKNNEEINYFPDIWSWKQEFQEIDPALISQDWLTIKNTMWNYVGLVRTKDRLLRAKIILRHLQSDIEEFYQKAKMTREILELRNGVQTALSIVLATLKSRESRGTHYIQEE